MYAGQGQSIYCRMTLNDDQKQTKLINDNRIVITFGVGIIDCEGSKKSFCDYRNSLLLHEGVIWEAEAGRSRGQEIKAILANTVKLCLH